MYFMVGVFKVWDCGSPLKHGLEKGLVYLLGFAKSYDDYGVMIIIF